LSTGSTQAALCLLDGASHNRLVVK